MAGNNTVGEMALNNSGRYEAMGMNRIYSAAAATNIFARNYRGMTTANHNRSFRKYSRRPIRGRREINARQGRRQGGKGLIGSTAFGPQMSGCRETVRGFLRVPKRGTCISFRRERGMG